MSEQTLPGKLNPKYLVFNENFGEPCIVSATNPAAFRRILMSGVIGRKEEDIKKKKEWTTGLIEELLDLDSAVWFKPGFPYNAQWESMPYGFIFDVDEIDSSFEVFEVELINHLYKMMLRFYMKYEPDNIQTISKTNEAFKEELNVFMTTDADKRYNNKGMPAGYFAHWWFHKELHKLYEKSSRKEELLNLIIKEKKKRTHRFFIKRFVAQEYNTANTRGAEIISHRDIMLDNKHFKGFFIRKGFLTPEVKKLLEKFINSAGNIDKNNIWIFDGYNRKILNLINKIIRKK